MAKDESKLVESVEESTESVESTTENTADDKFNPLAFTEDVELKELITAKNFAEMDMFLHDLAEENGITLM